MERHGQEGMEEMRRSRRKKLNAGREIVRGRERPFPHRIIAASESSMYGIAFGDVALH